MVKRYVLISVFVVFVFFGSSVMGYGEEAMVVKAQDAESLQTCTDTGLGVAFLCDPNWRIQAVDDALLIIVSTIPDVTLIVAKIDSKIKFLGQLTKDKLKELKQYKEGFVSEMVSIGGRDVLKVKAFSDQYPNRRLLDYYVIYDSNLYGILFAIEPKESMEEYKHLFKSIVESFSFIQNRK